MRNQNIILMVMGVVFIAVAFIVFPIIIEGAEQTRLATNLSSYTGMSSLVAIGPTLAFVVLILGGILSVGAGVRGVVRSRKASRR